MLATCASLTSKGGCPAGELWLVTGPPFLQNVAGCRLFARNHHLDGLGCSGVPEVSGFADDLLEETDGADGGKGLCAEAVHDLHVMINVRTPFQVQGAGELLDVGHVRQVRPAEPQHGERSAGPGVTAPPKRHDLHRDAGECGYVDETIQLAAHYLAAADRPAQ